MSARGLLAVLWMSSCGVAPAPYSSGDDFIPRGSTGSTDTRSDDVDVDAGLGTDLGNNMMSNTNICTDGGFCSSGECCGGTCCTIDQLCCNNRCERVTVNNPSCIF